MTTLRDQKELRRQKLRELDEEIGHTELAQRMGIAPAYLYQMTKGKKSNRRNVNDEIARLAEEVSGKPQGWMDGSDRPQRKPDDEVSGNSDPPSPVNESAATYSIAPGAPKPRKKIPDKWISLGGPELVYVEMIKQANLSAGSGQVDIEHERVEQSHAFRADYMRSRMLRPDKCSVWKVRGESMIPRYNDGDVVLIDKSDTSPRHGKVFALASSDGLRVKQLRKDASGYWYMHSFNPDQWSYPPEPVTEDIKIIGRVRWHAGDDD